MAGKLLVEKSHVQKAYQMLIKEYLSFCDENRVTGTERGKLFAFRTTFSELGKRSKMKKRKFGLKEHTAFLTRFWGYQIHPEIRHLVEAEMTKAGFETRDIEVYKDFADVYFDKVKQQKGRMKHTTQIEQKVQPERHYPYVQIQRLNTMALNSAQQSTPPTTRTSLEDIFYCYCNSDISDSD